MGKRLLIAFAAFLLVWSGCFGAESSVSLAQVQAAFEKPIAAHPRLLLHDDECKQLGERIQENPRMQAYLDALIEKADSICRQEPVERVLEGRRLLGVSRRCLDRVFTLSMVYRLTQKQQYLERAEQEMLAAAAFSDWNPSHFLDVAEMTTALAIGYDWLYQDLPETSRKTICESIQQKGLAPSLKSNGWLRNNNNWNQVCNGGMTLGALAIYEDDPDLAQQFVHRAVNSVPLAMRACEPDGAYPEGPGYWEYGTSYNVLLIAALDSVFGTDFGLSAYPGFIKTADYMLHVTGPTGLFFNYPDSGSKKPFSPTSFWFAGCYDKPYLVWNEYRVWERLKQDNLRELVKDRFAPLLLCWFANSPPEPREKCWMGQGINSVAMFRSSWTDQDAVFLAIKGGSPGAPHGHMDVGSFVLDAQGVRWGIDLGPENYNKIESRGMNLWSRVQAAQRWTIFRYNNLSHNTLVVDGQYQQVSGHAPIVRYSDDPDFSHVVIDMSSVYDGQLKQVYRGAALMPSGKVLIQDDIEGIDRPVTVRWAMVTGAKVLIQSPRQAVLEQDGKKLLVRVVSDTPAQLTIYSTEPKAEWDAPNPGRRMIGFEVELAAAQKQSIGVLMTPGNKDDSDIHLRPVLSWSDELDEIPGGVGSKE